MSVQKVASAAGLRTAVTGLLIGVVGVWFARTLLTVPTHVCVGGVLLVAAAAGAYMAGWVARGRTEPTASPDERKVP